MVRGKRDIFNKKSVAIATIVLVVIIGLIVTLLLGRHSVNNNSPVQPTESPNYQTVLPHGKSIGTLGGWQRISPAGNTAVYAYADAIDAIPISVSEQPLPDSFKSDVSGQVAQLAQSYNATDTLNADGTKVYVGTSVKGPQSVILTKNELLILIKSQQKISDSAWITYAKSLQ